MVSAQSGKVIILHNSFLCYLPIIELIADRYHMTKYPETVVILYKELILDSTFSCTINNIDKFPLSKNVINLSRADSY